MENWTVGKNKRKKKVKRGFYCNVQFQARLVESSGEGFSKTQKPHKKLLINFFLIIIGIYSFS